MAELVDARVSKTRGGNFVRVRFPLRPHSMTIIHENTIYAEPLFHIGSFNITNSLLNSWIVVGLIILGALIFKKKPNLVPSGTQNFFEIVIEFLLNIFDAITGSRKKSLKIFPLVFSFFIFILISNWLGLLPGFGSLGKIVNEDGQAVLIPFLRGATADLNTTLALAIFGIISSHIFGSISLGFLNHVSKFLNWHAVVEIFKKFKKDPLILFLNPVKIFVGFIEIIGEFAKIASLSFRLFGNIFAGEVVLASMSAIFAFGLPIPFLFLEIFVGLIQALIFSILVFSYLTMASISHEEH